MFKTCANARDSVTRADIYLSSDIISLEKQGNCATLNRELRWKKGFNHASSCGISVHRPVQTRVCLLINSIGSLLYLLRTMCQMSQKVESVQVHRCVGILPLANVHGLITAG